MTRTTVRWSVLYGGLILVLTLLGISNQYLLSTQRTYIRMKEDMLQQRTDLYTAAASIRGELHIRRWALAKGMVPASQIDAFGVSSQTAPSLPIVPQTTLEIETRWQ